MNEVKYEKNDVIQCQLEVFLAIPSLGVSASVVLCIFISNTYIIFTQSGVRGREIPYKLISSVFEVRTR